MGDKLKNVMNELNEESLLSMDELSECQNVPD